MERKSRKNRQHVSVSEILKTYFTVAKQYYISGIFVFVFYGFGVLISDIFIKLYYREIFDIIAGANTPSAHSNEVMSLFIIIVILMIAYNSCYRLGDFIITHFQTNVLRELSNTALEKLQHHSYNFFVGNFTGSLVAKVRRYVRAFETLHDKLIFNFWFAGIQLGGVFVILIFTIPSLALFFAFWATFLLGGSWMFARYRLKFDFLAAEADSAVTGHLSDILTNILNLKMFSSGGRELTGFSKTTHLEYKARRKAWHMGNAFHAFQGLAMALLESIGMYITLRMWLAGDISPGTVVLVQMYFAMIMAQVWQIGRAMSEAFKAFSDAEEMVAIFKMPLEIQSPSAPQKVMIKNGSIDLKNITFKYGNREPVFKNFSLHIPAGQRVGIVGHSGVGKSTLFKLLLRFVDISDGSILIDNQDIRLITQDDLRSHISYVPQEPILFHRSLYENIAYAAPDATKDDIIEATSRAHAHEFISKLPKEYETMVGERGIKLSGGERQRVAIARVLLKDAPILLLDEATSSLDSISENYVQEQLALLMKDRTTLAIAHRISTIQQMDRILVLEKGKIVEDGSHKELLSKKGLYSILWQHQSHGFLVEEE